jgi:formylmethanofuran dehydrogenase subunit E
MENEVKEMLETGFKFHGHRCPAMPLGMRAGAAAMRKLGVERASNKELYCVMETGSEQQHSCH